MTVEIRELIIKTEILSQPQRVASESISSKNWQRVKEEIKRQCRELYLKNSNKNSFNR